MYGLAGPDFLHKLKSGPAYSLQSSHRDPASKDANFGGYGGQSSRLVYWALPNRLKEPPAEPPIVTGLAKRVSHTREASVQIKTPSQSDLFPGTLFALASCPPTKGSS
jgi:hypothetical protein